MQMRFRRVLHYTAGRSNFTIACTVNLRYSDSGYSDNLGYSDRFVRIKLVKLAKVLPRYSHNFVCLIHIAITKVDCSLLQLVFNPVRVHVGKSK